MNSLCSGLGCIVPKDYCGRNLRKLNMLPVNSDVFCTSFLASAPIAL